MLAYRREETTLMAKQRKRKLPPRRDVEVIDPSYQPSKAELEEDLRLHSTFEDTVRAILRPANVRYVKPAKRA